MHIPCLYLQQALNGDPENVNERVQARHLSRHATKKRPQRLPPQKKMTRTHLCSTPPDANSRQQISSIRASSEFPSALYCPNSVPFHVPYRSPKRLENVHDAHHCLPLRLVPEPEREMSRQINSGEWSTNCSISYSETGKKEWSEPRTSNGPANAGQCMHDGHIRADRR